jgi:predicted lipid-binding transport protein (Tim44 family)
MDGKIDLTTLLFLVLAVVVFLKLRSVLGRRTGEEQARYERYKAQQSSQSTSQVQGRDKVVTVRQREREEAQPQANELRPLADAEERMKSFAVGNSGVARGLVEVFRLDASFDPEHFLKGARAAYEMIVTAFAEGNRKALQDLLSGEVFDGFANAISDRESRGEQMDQSFVGIKGADIIEAQVRNGIAELTVKFVSELISATRDRAGRVISGDPKRIREVTDIWTFARELASRNPNWRVVATQPAN